jgi:hypothetical protein
MIREECEQCGQRNVAGALFCESCQAYLGWDVTTSVPVAREGAGSQAMAGGWSAPTLVAPSPPHPDRRSEPADALRVVAEVGEVEVIPGGDAVSVEIAVHNQSEIVDAYVVDAPQAPEWLETSGTRVRLMPRTSDTLRLTLRIRDGVLALAQRLELPVRVVSEVDARVASALTLVVNVAEIDRLIALRVEPSVIRVRDEQVGEFVLVADNSGSNHPVHLRLSGQDAERVITVAFATPTLDVPAGGIATVTARLEAPLPDAGEETSRQLTVSAFDGNRSAQAVVTFTQRSSPAVLDPPMNLRLHPSVLTVVDAATGDLRLEIDNSNGRHEAQVVLGGYDPEGSVRFAFSADAIEVAPGATTAVTVRLSAAQPEPGVEASRPFTITARYEDRSVEASGVFRQRTSAAAISAIRLRVEPPNVRVRDGARGHVRVIADNRSGTHPARMWLTGNDHEGTGTISFSAPYLDIYPGQQATIDADIRAPRPAAGTEHSRGFTITATDGQHEVTAAGTFTQVASDRRPELRTLFTLLGGLAMIIGAFLPWTSEPERRTGVQWTIPALTGLFDNPGPKLNSSLAKIACAGGVIILLGVLAIWGRLGPKGRLTRQCALIGLLLIVGFLIFLHVRIGGSAPAVGAIVVMIGCVSAYVGGQLAKR